MRISKEQYSIISARRTNMDSMMWQTPALSLTAQAFLLTIALSSDSSTFAVVLASFLALVSSLAAMQLMMKHRLHEIQDSGLLKVFEESNDDYKIIHGPRDKENGFFAKRWSSYRVWMALLGIFSFCAAIIMGKEIWVYVASCQIT